MAQFSNGDAGAPLLGRPTLDKTVTRLPTF
jgi:hypothetical protein